MTHLKPMLALAAAALALALDLHGEFAKDYEQQAEYRAARAGRQGFNASVRDEVAPG